VRSKRSDEALDELRKATELDPGQARYAYVYAIALHSGGHANEALTALRENLDRHQNDRDTLVALISLNRESGDINSALQYATVGSTHTNGGKPGFEPTLGTAAPTHSSHSSPLRTGQHVFSCCR
jgi:predicted Zn-dependent protease